MRKRERVGEIIIMSLPGLPPLPKSLSGFDLAGIQFQSHHHQQHHHQQHPVSQHNPHYPPTHQHLHQQTAQAAHHHQMQQHQHQQQQQSFHGTSSHTSNLVPSSASPAAVLNHHHTNPFIPIGGSHALLHGDSSLASLESQQQRGHSPVSSTLSGGSSSGRKASPQPSGAGPAGTTTLDTQLAILRREMSVAAVCEQFVYVFKFIRLINIVLRSDQSSLSEHGVPHRIVAWRLECALSRVDEYDRTK
uniref:Uncharacterized protein n=1 Tax=Anopheles dirus TaxID=7168 RepID=A0A182NFC5_9DIPT